MKKYKNLFKQVCEMRNLNKAYLKARRGKNGSEEVLRFTFNLETELIKLQEQLMKETYKTGEYRHFIIFEPKERKISALPFRDRVVHHAICSVISPIFERRFIHDSYACRKGKGTHEGIKRIQSFVRKSGEDYYLLKCDVSKYFQSVDGETLKKIVKQKIGDEKLLRLINHIIDSSDEGIPIGNLTSQLFANIYLNSLDEYLKYGLRIKSYIRYMDDFLIIKESKKELHNIKEQIRIFLFSLRLTLHPKKANIFPIRLGIDCLGYKIFKNHQLVRKSTVKRFIRNSKKKVNLYERSEINFDKLMETFNSWEAYMSHANSYALKNKIHKEYLKNVA
ncbi:reverse transcriptase/maturase family protein [Candidatus Babeliales bacterium]|nr:reverse transcriptase/maturase family protein [Candidatus Babeliales bacterium]